MFTHIVSLITLALIVKFCVLVACTPLEVASYMDMNSMLSKKGISWMHIYTRDLHNLTALYMQGICSIFRAGPKIGG